MEIFFTKNFQNFLKQQKRIIKLNLPIGAWRLILKYDTEPYTPTVNAVGSMTGPGFAKLSDTEINRIALGGSYRYYKLTSEDDDKVILDFESYVLSGVYQRSGCRKGVKNRRLKGGVHVG